MVTTLLPGAPTCSLRNCGIGGTVPAALAAMLALSTLLLDGNHLEGVLPAALRQQSGRLQTVALFGNALQARI